MTNRIVSMSQDERWQQKYLQVRAYIETRHKNPSKHHIEDARMVHWIKYNKKLLHKGLLPTDREERFRQLLTLMSANRHYNQWV